MTRQLNRSQSFDALKRRSTKRRERLRGFAPIRIGRSREVAQRLERAVQASRERRAQHVVHIERRLESLFDRERASAKKDGLEQRRPRILGEIAFA